jgi:exodeoxyribonuclease-3
MKITTFNINNINKRLANLLGWLGTAKPDIVCLQELKSTDDAFPKEAVEQAGYRAVFCGQKSWNGVAILVGLGEPVLTRTALPGDPADTQSRYIEAAVNGVLIGTLYAPNGNGTDCSARIASPADLASSGAHRLPKRQQIDRSRFMRPSLLGKL